MRAPSKERGALTIGIANNQSAPLLQEVDRPIFLDTGAEPIAGSTRMKAGTAQRVALNLLSMTVCMDSSSESWEPQQPPLPWHSRASGGAVHSIKADSWATNLRQPLMLCWPHV